MRWYIFFLSCIAFSCFTVSKSDLTESCPNPPYNNNLAKIITDTIEAFRPFFENGAPELGIPPLDPLGPLPTVTFAIHNDYIDLEGYVNDTILYNLSKFIICELTVEIGIRPSFFIDIRIEDFHVEGFYDMDGVYVSIFPIFGTGNFVLDAYNASMSGGAQVSYNVLTDHVQIQNLELDIRFDKLELYMECILGCGDMADIVNQFLGELATAIFNALWSVIDPILTSAIEDGVNEILKDVAISEILTPGTTSSPGKNIVFRGHLSELVENLRIH